MRHPESIDILATEVRDQLSMQLRHFERMDTRAGVLLGFSGLLVALPPDAAGAFVAAARIAAVLSAASALATFLVRDFPSVDLIRLRKTHVSKDPALIQITLLDTHIEMLERVHRLTSQKTRRLKVTTSALFVSVLLASAGFLVENPP